MSQEQILLFRKYKLYLDATANSDSMNFCATNRSADKYENEGEKIASLEHMLCSIYDEHFCSNPTSCVNEMKGGLARVPVMLMLRLPSAFLLY